MIVTLQAEEYLSTLSGLFEEYLNIQKSPEHRSRIELFGYIKKNLQLFRKLEDTQIGVEMRAIADIIEYSKTDLQDDAWEKGSKFAVSHFENFLKTTINISIMGQHKQDVAKYNEMFTDYKLYQVLFVAGYIDQSQRIINYCKLKPRMEPAESERIKNSTSGPVLADTMKKHEDSEKRNETKGSSPITNKQKSEPTEINKIQEIERLMDKICAMESELAELQAEIVELKTYREVIVSENESIEKKYLQNVLILGRLMKLDDRVLGQYQDRVLMLRERLRIDTMYRNIVMSLFWVVFMEEFIRTSFEYSMDISQSTVSIHSPYCNEDILRLYRDLSETITKDLQRSNSSSKNIHNQSDYKKNSGLITAWLKKLFDLFTEQGTSGITTRIQESTELLDSVRDQKPGTAVFIRSVLDIPEVTENERIAKAMVATCLEGYFRIYQDQY